ncbi:hypothetical protein GGI42DRAFT_330861 [Trichoderma sp. SZMC 28013]
MIHFFLRFALFFFFSLAVFECLFLFVGDELCYVDGGCEMSSVSQSVLMFSSFLLVCLPHLSEDRNTWMRDAASQNTIDTTNLLFFSFVNPPVKADAVKTTHGYLFPSYTQLSPRLTLPVPIPLRVSQQHAGIHGTQHAFQLTRSLLFYVTPIHLFTCQCTDDSLHVYTYEFRAAKAKTESHDGVAG